MTNMKITIVLLSLVLVLFSVPSEALIKNDAAPEPSSDDDSSVSVSDESSDSDAPPPPNPPTGGLKDYHYYEKGDNFHGGHYEPKYPYHDHKYDYDYYKKSDKHDKYHDGKYHDDKYHDDKYHDGKYHDDKHHDDKHHDDKHDDKYDKYGKDYKFDKGDKYCKKLKSVECVCYIGGVDGAANAQLFQSVYGQQASLASTYTQPLFTHLALFSNKARGAYCVNNDVEMMVGTSDLNTYLTRFEATSTGASRVYTHDTGLESESWDYFVTRILLKRMYKIIDAYFLEFAFGFAQYDLNPLTNQKVSVSFPQTMCYDTAFFKDDCSRFVCQGQSGEGMTTYSRDPETGVNFTPPPSNNPWNVGRGTWYTSVRICKKNYISSIGYDTNEGAVLIARARYSLKYPYFKDIEEVWSVTVGDPGDNRFIYTPAHTNTIFACYDTTFLRFDDAYTSEATLTPAVTSTLPAACSRIHSFNKCPHEVYFVGSDNNLYYSSDGGVSWQGPVTFQEATTVHDITGFSRPVKDYY